MPNKHLIPVHALSVDVVISTIAFADLMSKGILVIQYLSNGTWEQV